jgi:hypothetical protein
LIICKASFRRLPRQLELLDGAKAKAKASGLWNFFLPDAETVCPRLFESGIHGHYPPNSRIFRESNDDNG